MATQMEQHPPTGSRLTLVRKKTNYCAGSAVLTFILTKNILEIFREGKK